MAAYLIAEIEVTDPGAYEDYRRQTPAAIAKYDGKFLVRGGKVETMEGGWAPKRLIVVEFPSMERALKFYRSAQYTPLIALRQKAAKSKLIIVEGT